MYKHATLSVVMPAYNEAKSIKRTILEIKSLGIVDDIVVVDNNSKDDTAKIAQRLGARVVKETMQGYGFACIRALKEASGDLVLLTEADCTFDAKDALKLLQYIDDVDMVIGSRVHKVYIHKNANMGLFIRIGNYFLGMLMQWLYSDRISVNDVGCTFRLIKRKSLQKIINKLRVGGSDFSPEMLAEGLNAGFRIIQVPVHYLQRRGETKLSQTVFDSIRIGLNHFYIIISRKY